MKGNVIRITLLIIILYFCRQYFSNVFESFEIDIKHHFFINQSNYKNQSHLFDKLVYVDNDQGFRLKADNIWFDIKMYNNETVGYIYSAYMDTKATIDARVLMVAVAYKRSKNHICKFTYHKNNNKVHVAYGMYKSEWQLNNEHHDLR